MNTKSGVHICTRAAIVCHIRFENLEVNRGKKEEERRTHTCNAMRPKMIERPTYL